MATKQCSITVLLAFLLRVTEFYDYGRLVNAAHGMLPSTYSSQHHRVNIILKSRRLKTKQIIHIIVFFFFLFGVNCTYINWYNEYTISRINVSSKRLRVIGHRTCFDLSHDQNLGFSNDSARTPTLFINDRLVKLPEPQLPRPKLLKTRASTRVYSRNVQTI